MTLLGNKGIIHSYADMPSKSEALTTKPNIEILMKK